MELHIAAASIIASAKLRKDGGLCTDGGILWNTGSPAIYVGLRNGIHTAFTHAVQFPAMALFNLYAEAFIQGCANILFFATSENKSDIKLGYVGKSDMS